MSLDAAAVPAIPRGVRLHFDRVRGDWVLLAPERVIRLDAIGHAILTEIDGRRSVESISATLAERYGAPADQVGKDCIDFVATLLRGRILDLAP